MAVKITELPEDTAPTGDDYIPTVDDIGGTPTTKRASVDALAKAMAGLAFADAVSPAALSAQTDNWNPTGFSAVNAIRVDLTGNQDLTGLATGSDGRIAVLFNIDLTESLTLKDESASSTAANRFALPESTDLVVAPESSVVLVYDGTSSRWRVYGGSGTGGGATAWTFDTGTSGTFTAGEKVVVNNASLHTRTLPATIAAGDEFEVAAIGGGGLKIAQNSGQTLYHGSDVTTTGVTGFYQSNTGANYVALRLVCVVANTDFVVVGSQGNWTAT